MSRRTEQVGSLIRQHLGEIIARDMEFSHDVLVTVTEVDPAPDLKRATVWVSILPFKFAGSAIERLRKASAGLRKELGGRISMRSTPKLDFKVDDREEHAAHIDELMRQAE